MEVLDVSEVHVSDSDDDTPLQDITNGSAISRLRMSVGRKSVGRKLS